MCAPDLHADGKRSWHVTRHRLIDHARLPQPASTISADHAARLRGEKGRPNAASSVAGDQRSKSIISTSTRDSRQALAFLLVHTGKLRRQASPFVWRCA